MSDHITISGVFSDPNGIPIAGAKIVITSQTNTQDTFRKLAVVQTTDEVGRYLFSLLPGGYNVVVLYPNGNQVVLGEFSLQTGSPSGTLNDYLLFGGQILTDPIIYSDIKRIYQNILLTAAVVQAESAASLKINHYLAEIAAAGVEAQTIARGNIGAIDGTGLLQTVNRLSEIAAAGAA